MNLEDLHLMDPFIWLVFGLAISMIFFTIFVGFVRSVAMIIAIIALVYYFALADKQTKDQLNLYSKNVFNSVLAKDGIVTQAKDKIINLTEEIKK